MPSKAAKTVKETEKKTAKETKATEMKAMKPRTAKTRKALAAVLAVIVALTMGQSGAFAYAKDSGSGEQTEPTKTASEMMRDGGADQDGTGVSSVSEEAGDAGGGTSAPGDATQTPAETGDTPAETSTDPEGTSTDPEEPSTDPTTEPVTNPTTKPTTKAKPTVPTVKVKPKGAGLSVSWTKIEGADYYEVYRSYKSGTTGKLIKKVKGTTAYRDNSTKSGKRAYYKVRAHKSKGGFYGYSKAVSGVIYRVYIEAGHGIDSKGKWDSGCTWKKYQEAKLMIPICQSMTKYLRSKNIYVYTDAFSGNNRNLFWLVKHIKNYDVSVLVNIHCDYKKAPRGTLPLYRYSEQKKLAKCLNAGVHKTVKIKDRGLKKRKNLLTLNKTKKHCTSCLFETGNIKKDNKILRKQYDAYGKGLAMGVCSYLGVKW